MQTRSVTNHQNVIDLQTSQEGIDRGEAEAITLALELEANLLLMDERRGKAVAISCGFNVTGILSVLLQAKRSGLIDAVKPMIDQLIAEADFRVS